MVMAQEVSRIVQTTAWRAGVIVNNHLTLDLPQANMYLIYFIVPTLTVYSVCPQARVYTAINFPMRTLRSSTRDLGG